MGHCLGISWRSSKGWQDEEWLSDLIKVAGIYLSPDENCFLFFYKFNFLMC